MNPKSEHPYVQLARRTLEQFVSKGSTLSIDQAKDIPLPHEAFSTRAGCFVTIKKNKNLRGCIGSIGPTQKSLALEIIHNAISSASRDPRFNPVSPAELSALVYSVDVLGPIEDISGPEELDVIRYGVIVNSGFKRGLLLPNLEGVTSIADQLAIAKNKAGIGPSEKVELQRFEVVRYD